MIGVRGGPGARAAAAFALALAACSESDPCDGASTCLRLDIDSVTVDTIDTLQLDVVYGDLHATTATGAGGLSHLPLSTAIILDLASPGSSIRIDVVAAGLLAGTVLGTGAATRMLADGDHAALAIALGPVEPCVDGKLYCGGDQLTGDPGTLYRCNLGGVPTARGRCVNGCAPSVDHQGDTCAAGPVCQDGGRYCGGDKVEGDPQTLYVCMAGGGIMPKLCASGCIIRPGTDDICR